jgi:formylglycine-generating enzyme required for sulfatase activity
MLEIRAIDITNLLVITNQFPARLQQLRFRAIQAVDEQGQDLYQYVLPPLVTIPVGPFLMGSDKQIDPEADDDDMPQHRVNLETYEIGIYPITVAEYAFFLAAMGYKEPINWIHQLNHPDHPIARISWNDIVTYAKWMTQVTTQSWRLPTEAEWEKADRGSKGNIYPWGNHWEPLHANTDEAGIETTTPIGTYPQGISPYGCLDTAGNVWEWTSTVYRKYPYDSHDSREDINSPGERVLRGGAWDFTYEHSRATFRGNNGIDIGFGGARLVRDIAVYHSEK